MRKSYLLIILLLLISYNLFSQQYFFRNFSINNGLPQSTVFCMLQDSRGYIWMGTDGGGVCKYDGGNIEIINKTNGLSGNSIRSLFEDSKGNIWIGSENGITVYDGSKYTQIGKKEAYFGSATLRIFESRDGNIWAGTNDAGLYKIELNDSLKLSNYSVSDGLVSNFIFDIYEDPNNRLWLAMAGGISIMTFTEDDKSVDVTKLIEGRDIPCNFITCIESDNNGHLLFGTSGAGAFKITNPEKSSSFNIEEIENKIIPTNTTVWDILYRSNGETWVSTNDYGIIKIDKKNAINSYNKENALETNQILDIMEDQEGNLWFSSMGSGAYMFSNNELISYYKKDRLVDNNINSLYYSNNTLFVGTNEGLAEYIIDNNSLKINKLYNKQKGLTNNKINAIAKDQSNNLWIGTDEGINIVNNNGIKSLLEKDGLTNNKINCLLIDKKNTVWVGTEGGYNKIVNDTIFSFTQDEGFINSEVQTIIQDKTGYIWMGTFGGLVKLDGPKYTDYNEEEGLNELTVYCLAEDYTGNIWIGTFGGGIYKFDTSKDSLPINLIADKQLLSSNNIYSLVFINDTSLIVGTDKGFDYISLNTHLTIKDIIHYDKNDGFVGGENKLNALSKDSNNNIWFGTSDGLIKYDPYSFKTKNNLPQTYITNLKLYFENIDWNSRNVQTSKWFSLPQDLELSYKDNHISFDFAAIYFKNPKDIEYSYFLEGQSKSWSPYTKNTEIVFPGLSSGKYTFKVKSKNKFDLISPVNKLNFYIEPPFYKKVWFIVSCIIAFIIFIILFIRYRESKLKSDKIKLEKIVVERTREVVQQKNEIEKQRDVVTNQKKEITDSINYAQNIQKAVLPNENILQEAFSDHFILFRPKDIVSGDFYWMSKKNDNVIFTAADCTGHGVPGAFMSMLGVSFLNEIVNVKGITQPDLILNELRRNIINSLQQKGLTQENKDGMDISICSIDLEKRKLYFAGANNPLLLIRKVENEYELQEFKGDRMPVAIYLKMEKFKCQEIDYKKGDALYLFSDGYVDQFGGPDGRKFMKKKFKTLLVENQGKTMDEQRTLYNAVIDNWMNQKDPNNKSSKQIDDIIVMGVRI